MPRKDAKGNLKTANHIVILVKTIIQVILEYRYLHIIKLQIGAAGENFVKY